MRCINCKQREKPKNKTDKHLGICKLYGFVISDSLSGCKRKEKKEKK